MRSETKEQEASTESVGNDFLYIPEEQSAKYVWSRGTTDILGLAGIVMFIVVLGIYAIWNIPGIAAAVGIAGMLFYITILIFRAFLMGVSLADEQKGKKMISVVELGNIDTSALPRYTILCPLYNEKGAVWGLVRTLEELNYPKEKLDIRFIIEEGDEETFGAVLFANPPGYMHIERIPAATTLRSKPRALNAVLPRCSDEGFLTIYDAEDRPERDQLLVAYLTFIKAPPEVVCLQAKIKHYNWNQNILTRWFAAEYAVWYDYILPALGRLKLPIPLGGNSNHFRMEFIKEVRGWDPYNMTEDANLGIEIARTGGKTRVLQNPTAVINSTTLEEAAPTLGGWVRQRSRWIKGYLQTFLVHIRDPLALHDELGFWGMVTFVVLLFGTPLTHLLNVVFAALMFSWWYWQPEWIFWFFPEPIGRLHVITFIIGNAMVIGMHVIASLREKKPSVALVSLAIPIYWALMAVATVKSVWQLCMKPHHWEHTHHTGDGDSMKKNTIGMAGAILISLAVTAPVYAGGITLPGASWGELQTRPSAIESGHPILRGWIEQGIAVNNWVAYAKLSHSLNPNGEDWYNAVTPALGVKHRLPIKRGSVYMGAEYQNEIRWQGEDRREGGLIGYIRWYTDWDVKLMNKR